MFQTEIQELSRRGSVGRAATFPKVEPLLDVPVLDASGVDDLNREAYCILGLPIDAVDLTTAVQRIDAAATIGMPFLLSTPNLNFLVLSRADAEFRQTLLDSNLCPADGMPILWMARLIGVPLKERVSGADIFDALRGSGRRLKPLRCVLVRRCDRCGGGGGEDTSGEGRRIILRGYFQSRLRFSRRDEWARSYQCR